MYDFDHSVRTRTNILQLVVWDLLLKNPDSGGKADGQGQGGCGDGHTGVPFQLKVCFAFIHCFCILYHFIATV